MIVGCFLLGSVISVTMWLIIYLTLFGIPTPLRAPKGNIFEIFSQKGMKSIFENQFVQYTLVVHFVCLQIPIYLVKILC